MESTADSPHIRRVSGNEVDLLFSLMNELAEFEKLVGPDEAAKQRFIRDAFSEHPRIEAYLVYVSNEPAGYAIILETYSSFACKPTLYLEDIYVRPDYRSRGIGKQVMTFIVDQAAARDCGRIEWQVLDWNTPAISFYDALGATPMKQWIPYRITAEGFEHVRTKLSTPA